MAPKKKSRKVGKSGKPGKDKVVCACKHVTKGDIQEAVKAGATSYKQVREVTGAGSGCGHCKDDVKRCIKKTKRRLAKQALADDGAVSDAELAKKAKKFERD